VVASTLVVGVPTAAAYKIIDDRCILRAYVPSWDGNPGGYVVSGEVDCSGWGNEHTQIQVCGQVYNPSVYPYWFTVNGSCSTSPVVYMPINYWYNDVGGVQGHEYRSWDWGDDIDLNATATYNSSGYTCGCP
jgi:hypothetical protein